MGHSANARSRIRTRFTKGKIIKSPRASKYPVLLKILRRGPNDEECDGEDSKDLLNSEIRYECDRCIHKYIFEIATR